jgi:predicted nucleic acid-binding protein
VIFVDSGAWFASVIATDPDHAAAAAWLASNREALLTTDYVLDETLTLLRARGQSHIAVALGAALVAESLAVLHFCTKDEISFRLGHVPTILGQGMEPSPTAYRKL